MKRDYVRGGYRVLFVGSHAVYYTVTVDVVHTVLSIRVVQRWVSCRSTLMLVANATTSSKVEAAFRTPATYFRSRLTSAKWLFCQAQHNAVWVEITCL
jgi:hypothetical protein